MDGFNRNRIKKTAGRSESAALLKAAGHFSSAALTVSSQFRIPTSEFFSKLPTIPASHLQPCALTLRRAPCALGRFLMQFAFWVRDVNIF